MEEAGTNFGRYTDRSRKLMALATKEAKAMNCNYIGTEHMALGLCGVFEGVGGTALSNLGVTPMKLREEVQRLLGAEQSTPRDSATPSNEELASNIHAINARVSALEAAAKPVTVEVPSGYMHPEPTYTNEHSAPAPIQYTAPVKTADQLARQIVDATFCGNCANWTQLRADYEAAKAREGNK